MRYAFPCERPFLRFATALSALPLLALSAHAQAPLMASATPVPPSTVSSSASASFADMPAVAPAPEGAAAGAAISVARPVRPREHFGVAVHAGLEGIGVDSSLPLSNRLQVRATLNMGSYSTSFTDQGANVNAQLYLQSERISADWFVFGGRFHVSPLFTMSNHNAFRGTVLVPGGQNIDMDGSTYVSSTTDPLRGAAEVSFRRNAPGLAIGFGNHARENATKLGHWSFPTEIGFYYVGQPKLNVSFTGTACDPTQPANIGCEKVMDDPGFQKSLSAFIARNNHNLSYASFMPILNTGVAFRF